MIESWDRDLEALLIDGLVFLSYLGKLSSHYLL